LARPLAASHSIHLVVDPWSDAAISNLEAALYLEALCARMGRIKTLLAVRMIVASTVLLVTAVVRSETVDVKYCGIVDLKSFACTDTTSEQLHSACLLRQSTELRPR
jgi:hypothetical protein